MTTERTEINLEQAQDIASNLMDNERTIGLELECFIDRSQYQSFIEDCNNSNRLTIRDESYNHNTRGHWKIVHDASLGNRNSDMRGIEIVSPPLKAKDLFLQLNVLLEILNSYNSEVNKTCGLHCHHSLEGFKAKQLQYLVNHFVKNESAIDTMLAESRRGNQESVRGFKACQSNKALLTRMIRQDAVQSRAEGQGSVNGVSRYTKLNLQSYSRYGTCEFRGYQGTLDFTKIVVWVALTQNITLKSRTKVKQTNIKYNNNMFNLLLSTGWATREGRNLKAKSFACHLLCSHIIERQLHFGFSSVAPSLDSFENPYSDSMLKRKSALKAMLDLREQILNAEGVRGHNALSEFLSNERIANTAERLLADNLL
tara:strand:+ start:61 stop:1170 length:1110 start_codon:yes stop_codon:yes gene_type:complete